MEEIDFNITIVGLGLIGGSFAMALRELNPRNLWGVDKDLDALKFAEKKGIIDCGYLDPKIPLNKSDIVIICLYPNTTIEFIKNNIINFKDGAVITDTAGIKEILINEVNTFLPDNIDFIGGHPMAGGECKGIHNASKDIFNGANYILTPTERNKLENILMIERIAKLIGCKNVVHVTPKEHDEIIAYTSHLPHVLAAALITSDINVNTNLFVGGSFNDATRVAKINTDLWLELILENKENILNKISLFERNISNIKNAIELGNKEELATILNTGSLKKEILLKS
ncbi:MAG: prephenate dehydrogenase [Vulcanibacillus sp.]